MSETRASRPSLRVLGPAELDAALTREGWQRRFVAAPPRLHEAVELYRALGHDVRLEALSPDELAQVCQGCHSGMDVFRVVYTRRPS